jgi:hypothetical protein
MNSLISNCEIELAAAIQSIQQPRSDFQLKHFVVGQHDAEPRRWWQCVLELQIKIQSLKRARVHRRQLMRKIRHLRDGSEESKDEAELLQLELEEHDLAVLGALREAEALYAIYKSFPRQYSNEELNAAEEDYWRRRLNRQAVQDLASIGRVGIGNLDSLRQIGKPLSASLIREIEGHLCLQTNHEEPAN